MASRQLDEEAIFHVARRIDDLEARGDYLDQVCAGDQNLRERVESLLNVYEQEGEFLKSPPEPAPTVDQQPITERPGTVVGRYHLMEQIGEGGMGVVFVAEQQQPIRRKVALKIIKPGMDTKEVIGRFEAERQALALMDHPNIAKVLDAGATESGRPYFVMELVRGVPITDYCDANKLSICQRLELFVTVCQAIQHAHQKGIIHRDVKPSNVLVTLHDGVPVPKVIDFGVAKAISQRLTERTIYTRFAQVVGTPRYMSPEQAEMSGLDIDTRTDVYSLGVLLYELLTGATPFDQQTLEKACYDEIRRIIREQEPPKPSTKISTLGETATTVSANRGTDPRSLSRFVMGDLDVLVMKALEKDRTRRYDSASALGDDVRRFLESEPIVARPPSVAYRFAKFARRNRATMVTSALVLAMLVVGIVATTWLAVVARRQAERATHTLQRFAESLYEHTVAAAIAGDQEEAQKTMKALEETRMISQSRLFILKGLLELTNGRYDEAVKLADEVLSEDRSEGAENRVGAQALLAISGGWVGYDDRSAMAAAQLRQLPVSSDTDAILKAYATITIDSAEAIRLLDNRPRIQRSPIGLFLRGFNEYYQGVDQQDAGLLDKAAEDLRCAQFLFHDSRGPKAIRLEVLAAALDLAQREKRENDVLRLTQEGRPLANELSGNDSLLGDDYSVWMFRLLADDTPEEATRAIRKACSRGNTYSWLFAADCLRRNRGDAALREFEAAIPPGLRGDRYVRLAYAQLLANTQDGREKAQELAKDLLGDSSPVIVRYALVAMCPACTSEEIHDRARKVTVAIEEESKSVGSLWGGKPVAYLTGNLTESEFLETVSSGGNGKVIAHFTIAMMKLAEENREEAKKHFQIAVATRTIGTFDYEWARAYLARMDADSSWPEWAHKK